MADKLLILTAFFILFLNAQIISLQSLPDNVTISEKSTPEDLRESERSWIGDVDMHPQNLTTYIGSQKAETVGATSNDNRLGGAPSVNTVFKDLKTGNDDILSNRNKNLSRSNITLNGLKKKTTMGALKFISEGRSSQEVVVHTKVSTLNTVVLSTTIPETSNSIKLKSVRRAHSRHANLRLVSNNVKTFHQSVQKNQEIASLSSNVVTQHRNLTVDLVQKRFRCSCQGTKCVYSYCSLTSVPQGLPINITQLILNSNNIETLQSNVFSSYVLMENLDLCANSISVLENDSFRGLSRLKYLNLTSNELKIYTFPVLIFEPLKSLKMLRIDNNILECQPNPPSPDIAFSYLHNVEELHIDNYIDPDSEEGFGSGFRNMSSLRKLIIVCSSCSFESLWNGTFIYLEHITTLDISNCGITGPYIESDTFFPLRNLETLDISLNLPISMQYLPVILRGLYNSSLQTLRMDTIVDAFSLNFINSSIIEYLPRGLTTLSARGNNIVYINPDVVKILPRTLKTVDISENNIVVDPKQFPLEEMKQLKSLLLHRRFDVCIKSSSNIIFQSLCEHVTSEQGGDATDFTDNTTERKVGTVIPLSLKCVQINVEDMYNEFLLDIDIRNEIQYLDMSCSDIYQFNFQSLNRLQKLTFLNFRKSFTYSLQPPETDMSSLKFLLLGSNFLGEYFSSLPLFRMSNLTHIDMSENRIANLHKTFFNNLEKLEYIRLDGNMLSSFDVTISHLTQLKRISLNGTEVSKLPNHVRSHIDHVNKVNPGQIKIDMVGCPIQCDCFNLDFLKWMVNSPAFDKNFTGGYKCKYSDASLKYIGDGYKETIYVLDRECAKNYPMFLVILAATFLLLSAVIGTIIYRLRWKIRYLYYAAYLKVTKKQKNDDVKEFAYDVFLSYDSDDQIFVTRILAKELENRGLRLLIHGRDFVAGTYIASNIVMAVAESRKTLVILTRNLIQSPWCNYEIQMATMEAVHTGRSVLLFLLKENIPTRELDLELVRYIRNNTYMPYPNMEDEEDEDVMRQFYDKLVHDLKY
uniref:TIR domain-containing protein n=2 Tax=Arion vulgaris TaxID=1028688 RepID=A0A0B7BBF9_9EUPU